jgi:hypothetical protein
MTVRQKDDGTIVLTDGCPAEDAEPLLELLQSTPDAPVDWKQCDHLHTAVLQVIMAARPVLVGPCGDPWIRQWAPFRRE